MPTYKDVVMAQELYYIFVMFSILFYFESYCDSANNLSLFFTDNQHVVLRQNHTLEKRGQRKICVGCYRKLRETFNSRDAQKKSKKIKSFCVQCERGYCVQCFYTEHILYT